MRLSPGSFGGIPTRGLSMMCHVISTKIRHPPKGDGNDVRWINNGRAIRYSSEKNMVELRRGRGRLGGFYATILCSLHLILKQHILWRRYALLWKEERPRDESIGCRDALCCLISRVGWIVWQWGMSQNLLLTAVLCFVIFGTYSLLTPVRVCSIYNNTIKWSLRNAEGGCHDSWRLLLQFIFINHQTTWLWGWGTDECSGLPEEGDGWTPRDCTSFHYRQQLCRL